MPRFFEMVNGDRVVMSEENAAHMIKSLRMKVGEAVTLCDGKYDYGCIISAVGNGVECQVISKTPNATEPAVEVTLYQCVPKGDKLESVVQKAVELGAHRIVPVLSDRCVSRPDEKSAAKKAARYNKIALEACKQCGRGKIVGVSPMIGFSQAVEQIHSHDCALFFYEGGGEKLNAGLTDGCKSIAVFIGPEGGFEEHEVAAAKAAGAKICSLGPRILRTETAPLAAICAVMLLTDNF